VTEYYLYHDESKEQGFWHAFLLVPVSFRNELGTLLTDSRQNHRLQRKKLSFKGLNKDPHFRCAKTWFTLFVASLQNARPEKMVEYFWGTLFDGSGKKSGEYRRLERIPGCKASILYFPQGQEVFSYCSDYPGQFAAAFKMGAKGIMNHLLPQEEPSQISKVFIDGEKHFGVRPLPKDRLLKNLQAETQEHISIADRCAIEGHEMEDQDRLILDAVDLFLGAFRYTAKIIPEHVSEQGVLSRMDIAKQGNDLVDYLNRHPAGKKPSRFFRGIAMSEARIDNGTFRFSPLSLRMLPESQGIQGDLFEGES
jgi:hypothetical protein